MRNMILPALIVTLAGCAATPAETAHAQAREARNADRMATALAGLTPGRPTDCISELLPTYTTQSYGETILYRVSRKLIYRNDTAGGCGLGDPNDGYIVTISPTGRLCRGDQARVIQRQSGAFLGSCALGAFTPYTAP